MRAKTRRVTKVATVRRKPSRPKPTAIPWDKIPKLFSKEWKELPFGHPWRLLALAGTLTPEEGEIIRRSVKEFDAWHQCRLPP